MDDHYQTTAVETASEMVVDPLPSHSDEVAYLRLLTRREVAWRLNVSTRTVDRLVEDGSLTPIDIRGVVRFHPDDVTDLIERKRRPKRRLDTTMPVRKPARKPRPQTGSFRERKRNSSR